MLNPILQNRDMSGFPVSIGTGLALETLFSPETPVVDESRQVVKVKDLSDYNLYAINVTTLIRNLVSSVKSTDLQLLKPRAFYPVVEEEINYLTSLFSMQGIELKLYLHDYTYFKDKYKDRMRQISTPLQHHISDILDYCVSETKKHFREIPVFTKDVKFEGKCLMMTHVPADLLSYRRFSKLDLLESHTGIIKSRKDWNSKYYPVPKEDMSFLPFMEYLLTDVFGDKVMFKPAPLKKRLEVHKAMLNKGVHPLMSETSLGFLFGI